MHVARRSGFSLIEALVVLAIGGMALAVIFSIGLKAGDTGFALGRRAMSAADTDVAIRDLRVILRSMDLRPPELVIKGTDRPMIGSAKRLEGDVVLEQATTCAPQGWAGRLTLSIEETEGSQTLICQIDSKRTPLMTWSRGELPGFSYSDDSQTWVSDYATASQPPALVEMVTSKTMWIRLSARPGTDIIEQVSSGRPERWMRMDAPY